MNILVCGVMVVAISSFALGYEGPKLIPGDSLKVKSNQFRKHNHSFEGGSDNPCFQFSNDTDEVHFFARQSDRKWQVNSILINRGTYSPHPKVHIGDPLAKLESQFPGGKLLKTESEVTGPLAFRVENEKGTVDFVIDVDFMFVQKFKSWDEINVKDIPRNSKVLTIFWD